MARHVYTSNRIHIRISNHVRATSSTVYYKSSRFLVIVYNNSNPLYCETIRAIIARTGSWAQLAPHRADSHTIISVPTTAVLSSIVYPNTCNISALTNISTRATILTNISTRVNILNNERHLTRAHPHVWTAVFLGVAPLFKSVANRLCNPLNFTCVINKSIASLLWRIIIWSGDPMVTYLGS